MTSATLLNRRIIELPLVVASAVALPYLFHMAGLQGAVFLPMYIGIVIYASLAPTFLVLIAASLAPLANHLATGMPLMYPMPIVQMLTIELIALALLMRLLYRKNVSDFVKIPVAILGARGTGIIAALIYPALTVPQWVNIIKISIPGILMNIVIGILVIKLYSRST